MDDTTHTTGVGLFYWRKRFDAYEIAPVACWTQPGFDGGESCDRHETLAEAEDQANEYGGYVIWTLYGHRENEGVEAIADSSTLEGAARLLSSIIGKPVEVNSQAGTLVRN